jgi:hypothetical protein
LNFHLRKNQIIILFSFSVCASHLSL